MFQVFGVRAQGKCLFLVYFYNVWGPCAGVCVHRHVIIGDRRSAMGTRRSSIGDWRPARSSVVFLYLCNCLWSVSRDVFLYVSIVLGSVCRDFFFVVFNCLGSVCKEN